MVYIWNLDVKYNYHEVHTVTQAITIMKHTVTLVLWHHDTIRKHAVTATVTMTWSWSIISYDYHHEAYRVRDSETVTVKVTRAVAPSTLTISIVVQCILNSLPFLLYLQLSLLRTSQLGAYLSKTTLEDLMRSRAEQKALLLPPHYWPCAPDCFIPNSVIRKYIKARGPPAHMIPRLIRPVKEKKIKKKKTIKQSADTKESTRKG